MGQAFRAAPARYGSVLVVAYLGVALALYAGEYVGLVTVAWVAGLAWGTR